MISGYPIYSICSTNYDNVGTIRESLNSLISQTDDRFEIVVVDSESKDGAELVLKQFAEQGQIRLISKRCERGAGRQIALESAKGKYILPQIDMDDIYKPCFKQIVEYYHTKHEGEAMLLSGVMVCPRDLLVQIGGWRNLQWGEDRDVWFRLAKIGKLVWIPFEVRERIGPPSKMSIWQKISARYKKARDSNRLGLDPFADIKKGTSSQFLYVSISLLGIIRSQFSSKFYKQELANFDYRKFGKEGEQIEIA